MKNKKLLSFILIVVMIFGVAPYFLGNMAKENIETQAAQMSQMPGYTLKLSDYNQGWFTSHATLSYGFDEHTLNILKKSANKGEDFDKATFNALKKGIVFDIIIAHGPITFHNGINFAFLTLSGNLRDIDHKAYRTFMKKAKINSLVDLFASVSYGGTTSFTLHSPAFKADYSESSNEKLTFDFSGMDIDGTINASLDKYEANAQMGKLAITMENGTIVLNQLNMRASGGKINDYLWTGNGTTSLGNFNLIIPKSVSFTLLNLTSDYDISRESDTALAVQSTFKVENISTNEVDLKNFHLDFDLNHLDLEAITDYVKSINESYQTSDVEMPTPEQTAAKIQVIAARVGDRLVKGSPELIINNFNFLMGKGTFESDGKISLNGEGLDNITLLSDPITLNKRLSAIVNIKFDKALAIAMTTIAMKTQMSAGGVDIASMPKEQLDQMINVQATTALQSFVNQGYFRQDGDKYITHFKMKDGQRLVNGKPLPIPGM